MFGHYTYLLSIIFFAGASILLEWFFNFNLLKKSIRSLLKVTILLALYAFLLEFLGFSLTRGGYFNKEMVLGFWIGPLPIEEVLFWPLTISAMASATIIFSEAEEKNLNLFQAIIFFFSKRNRFVSQTQA